MELTKADTNRQRYLCIEQLEVVFRKYDKSDTMKCSVKTIKSLLEPWKEFDEDKFKKFEKSLQQLGDEGKHLMNYFKEGINKLFK